MIDPMSRLNLRSRDVYRFFINMALHYPFWVLGGTLLTVVVSLLLSLGWLEFHTNRLDLVSSANRYKQLDEAFTQEFEDPTERVIVVIRSTDPEQAKAFATALAERWKTDPTIEKVFYRIPLETLREKALLYLSEAQLADLRQTLEQHQELLEEFAAQPTLANLFALINRETTRALVNHVFTDFLNEGENKPEPLDLSFLLTILRQMNQRLDRPGAYVSPWGTLFTRGIDEASHDGFLWSDDRQLLFVLANPRTDAGDFNRFRSAVQNIRQDVRELQRAYPGIEVGITGKAILESDEMAVGQRDMGIATLISLVGVAVLLIFFFRGVVRPVLTVVALLVGMAWSLGLTTLTLGHLNIFTIMFAPMLIGLGMDYGIHFTTRYEEERRARKSVPEALAQTFIGTGSGIVMAAVTTALAFYALALPDFLGLRELGFVSGSGLLLILLATFTALPALLVLDERFRSAPMPLQADEPVDEQEGYLKPLYRYPWTTVIVSAAFVGLSLLALGKVKADFNLLRLQSGQTESVIWVQRIFESSKRSVLNGELMASSLEEVGQKVAALHRLPTVEKVDSILSVIPEHQEDKRRLLMELQPLLTDIVLQPLAAETVNIPELRFVLQRLATKFAAENNSEVGGPNAATWQQIHQVQHLISQFLQHTENDVNLAVLASLGEFQAQLRDDLTDKLALLQHNLQAEPITSEDLPSELRSRYIGKTGKFRLFVFPAEDIWELPALGRFVQDLTTADTDALGAPVTNYAYIRAITMGYEKAGIYALSGILFLTFCMFRGVIPTMLALVPLLVGVSWTLGLMVLFQLPFNMANLLFIPLIIGIGIDNGIYIVHRFREEAQDADKRLPLPGSTGRSVNLATLTTIVGFGSMMISGHQGIYSLGLLVTLGVGSILIASLSTLPSLLALMARRQARQTEVSGGYQDIADKDSHHLWGQAPERSVDAQISVSHNSGKFESE
jgi:hopanoid biosynthesis associated RND transporter like protein HpnN